MRARLEEVLKSRSIPVEANVRTAELCTFRIGGVCRYLITPRCIDELVESVLLCRELGVPYHVIGKGSNILFADGTLPIALIRTVCLDGVRAVDGGVIADCGVSLPRLARRVAAWGFADLAFAAGIPGTLGGAVFMNAGAHQMALGDLVEWVRVLLPQSGEIKTYFHQKLSFSYRNSYFQHKNEIILQVCLHLQDSADPARISTDMRAMLAHRAATQPLGQPSAGSVFLRTENGVSMGKIIDELGLKGTRCGNAAISEKHAGFIVNLGGATAADVCHLIDIVKRITEEKRGFQPKTEIRLITGKEES